MNSKNWDESHQNKVQGRLEGGSSLEGGPSSWPPPGLPPGLELIAFEEPSKKYFRNLLNGPLKVFQSLLKIFIFCAYTMGPGLQTPMSQRAWPSQQM